MIDLHRRIVRSLCEEWAEDDSFIETLCLINGLTEEEVYGNSYHVPGIREKVEMLVKKLGGKIIEE